jgi:endoglucanase
MRRFISLMLVLLVGTGCVSSRKTMPVSLVSLEPTQPPTTTPLPTTIPTPTLIPYPTLAATMPPNYIFDQNKRLGRGVNLGNALEAPREGEWGVTLQEGYFQLIKEAGFNSVRIPIRWNAHAAATPPYTIDPAFFERIDWAVNQATSRGLVAIINIHHYLEMFEDPAAHRERFLAIWNQIATHYKDYPDSLFFEPLNEPNGALNYYEWNQIARDTLAIIRQNNPTRPVVIGPADWNSISMLKELKLPEEDRNIIVTFHYYQPFQFTHQGADWAAGSEAWLGTTWKGTSAEKGNITWDFDIVANWSKENNRPIYLGEFGAYSEADMDSRALWTNFIARQAEARGFSWAYWEFCSGFGVYDPVLKMWNEPLLTALIPK